jgi:hypothetical protein
MLPTDIKPWTCVVISQLSAWRAACRHLHSTSPRRCALRAGRRRERGPPRRGREAARRACQGRAARWSRVASRPRRGCGCGLGALWFVSGAGCSSRDGDGDRHVGGGGVDRESSVSVSVSVGGIRSGGVGGGEPCDRQVASRLGEARRAAGGADCQGEACSRGQDRRRRVHGRRVDGCWRRRRRRGSVGRLRRRGCWRGREARCRERRWRRCCRRRVGKAHCRGADPRSVFDVVWCLAVHPSRCFALCTHAPARGYSQDCCR